MSYSDGKFFSRGIHVYNFGWEDMTAPKFQRMLNVCHVMHSHIVQVSAHALVPMRVAPPPVVVAKC